MLNSYGWSDTLQQQFQTYAARGLAPARVIVQQRGLYVLATPMGEAAAQLSGRFAHEAEAGAYPVAGDWVAAAVRAAEASATIHHLLPRRSAFMRKAVGGGGAAQVVAANVDVAFLVASLNGDLNAAPHRALPRHRLGERRLAGRRADQGRPVRPTATRARPRSRRVALGVPVHVVSAVTGRGTRRRLSESFAPGQTAVLLGSSGVGKSSLVNALAGAALMVTQAIREDDARGRHTTTHRQLVLLPNGRLVLDTPGMRELGLWDAEAGVAATFADIEALAAQCRFRDCAHEAEPGCAIQAALADGSLDAGRWRSYVKLQRELAHLARKDDPRERAEVRKVWIQRSRDYRAQKRRRMEDD